ncbi:MAG: SDR family NAD(P)-dependent oxidoreductase [Acidobacteriota bacterium]|nr:SDR family NAD(P)-dependent oxidoreductase [Acidobacteriota bacterium]
MRRILVIGASGFLGRHIARALLRDDYAVDCLARNPSRVQDLVEAGCEVTQGDISDLASVQRALQSVDAVYVSIHTLSPQPASAAGQGFMEVERNGLENIVTACRTNSVRRLIYVTFLGISPDSPSAWVRGRWEAEQFLLKSGLDVTVIRPAQIVGVGGRGFDMMVGGAKKSVAMMMASAQQRNRNIALDDLVYYMVGVLNDPRAYGQCYDVGCDDILTNDQMMDIAAEVLGRKHPLKIHISPTLLGALAPVIERVSKFPRGAIKGIVDSFEADAIGDPRPIRVILPRPPLPYR